MARRSSYLADFQAFINKGNVVDLAVAVVIGGAFGRVVDEVVSLVMSSKDSSPPQIRSPARNDGQSVGHGATLADLSTAPGKPLQQP